MPGSPRPVRPKRADRYHHGDLRRALVREAVRTIRTHGVERLTLRAIGARLGVSRTALYRHFADKSALLAEVAQEGFRTLKDELVAAWERGGKGPAGFAAMSEVYVRFAVTHPSHYRVMFGGLIESHGPYPELNAEATAAFQVLVDAILAQQRDGVVRADDPLQLARYIWAVVHGIAMLGIDGRLSHAEGEATGLAAFAAPRIREGIGRP